MKRWKRSREFKRVDGRAGGSESGASMKIVILFVTVCDSLAHLDCVTAKAGEAGWPFSVDLGLTSDAEWAAGAERRMRAWASGAQVLDLDVSGPERVRVRLSDGGQAIVFGEIAGPPPAVPREAN